MSDLSTCPRYCGQVTRLPHNTTPDANSYSKITALEAALVPDQATSFRVGLASSFPNSVWERGAGNSVSRRDHHAKQSFAAVRSQTEFGNETETANETANIEK